MGDDCIVTLVGGAGGDDVVGLVGGDVGVCLEGDDVGGAEMAGLLTGTPFGVDCEPEGVPL